MRVSRMSAVAGALALLVTVGGCARPDDDPTPVATAGETAEPTTPAADPSGPEPEVSPTEEPVEDPGDDPTEDPSEDPGEEPGPAVEGPAFVEPGTVAEQAPGGAQLLTVTDVRAADNGTFDRVVFDLDGEGTPGWRVEYVDEALDDGSGNPVPVDGGAVLQVRIAGTGMPMDTGVQEYSGGPVSLSGAAVQEVVYRFVFEGYTTAFVGVDEQRPFRVFVLQDPLRLVVDVQH